MRGSVASVNREVFSSTGPHDSGAWARAERGGAGPGSRSGSGRPRASRPTSLARSALAAILSAQRPGVETLFTLPGTNDSKQSWAVLALLSSNPSPSKLFQSKQSNPNRLKPVFVALLNQAEQPIINRAVLKTKATKASTPIFPSDTVLHRNKLSWASSD